MKLLFLDIETAPHQGFVWGLFKQNVYMDQIAEAGYTLCWAAKWKGSKEVIFNGLNRSSNKEMLEHAHSLMDEADVICHYNGRRFDVPILNQEFLLHGMDPPSSYQQIDLLSTVRKNFRFPTNKLDYVAQYLGLGNKTKHKGMEMWRGCMEGEEKHWKVMERYNKQDVKLLEKVYYELLPWTQHPNVSLYHDGTEVECPSCGSKHLQSRGHYTTKTQRYKRFQCQNCHSWSRQRTSDLTPAKRQSIIAPL